VIAVLHLDDGDLPTDAATIPGEYVAVRSLEALTRIADSAVCLLVVARSGGCLERETLLRIRRGFPTKPLLLLVPLSPSCVDIVVPFLTDRLASIVWDAQPPEALQEALCRALHSDPLREFHRFVHGTVHPSAVVSNVFRLVCLEPRPPSSVRALAERIGVAESTLRYHWAMHFPAPRLRELIQWSLFLRGVTEAERANRLSASRIAGVHIRTLQRMSRRLLGRSFGETVDHPELARQGFERWAVATFSTV
jgi:hypothetical protein